MEGILDEWVISIHAPSGLDVWLHTTCKVVCSLVINPRTTEARAKRHQSVGPFPDGHGISAASGHKQPGLEVQGSRLYTLNKQAYLLSL